MEVQEALKFVQERVASLKLQQGRSGDAEEEEEGEEGEGFGEAAEEMSVADRVAYHKKVLEKMQTRKAKADDEVSNVSHMSKASVMTTESQLLHDGGLKQVHSAASVRALMKAATTKPQLGMISEGTVTRSLAVPEPVVATSHVRAKIELDPSNLPYLKRHPAV
jgi:hypothetical protein